MSRAAINRMNKIFGSSVVGLPFFMPIFRKGMRKIRAVNRNEKNTCVGFAFIVYGGDAYCLRQGQFFRRKKRLL